MKKYLLLCMVLVAFALPTAAAFADDHEWNNGDINNDRDAPPDDGSTGHSGGEAQ